MRYRVVVHAPAPVDEEVALSRLRDALAAAEVEVAELRIETRGEQRAVHVETALDAPSAYHCAAVQAPELFTGIFAAAEIPVPDAHGLEVTAARPDAA